MVTPDIMKAWISLVIAATRCLFVGPEEWDESRTAIANDPTRSEWTALARRGK